MKDYLEHLWEGLPNQLTPPDVDRRAAHLLTHLRPAQRVLDLGCGDGVFAELMLEHAAVELTLAEVAEAALARALARPRIAAAAARAVLVPFDGPLPLPDSAFDLVWASEVIEHVADTGRWLGEVQRVLAPGGTVALTTPNHTRWRLALAGAGTVSPPLGDHLHLYDRTSLRGLLREFGFDAVEVSASGRLGPQSGLLLASARSPHRVSTAGASVRIER